ncbi:uncharacterized protein LOC130577967 [Malurus melanocephalus]|uniref:uncharacterized protein LOC130577967 n=1 Tax=Malurus melanocephalus TaxID=175006 RepID=UPI0025494A65|nr:uncharacterized protein LOC130577967 [Malurus melanocephalus]
MAPRIRLSLSKPLPTIRETHEEAMEDPSSAPKRAGSTAASPDSYSSEDYIQSICHLARPTFPALLESRRKGQDRKTLQSLEDVSRSPALEGTQQERLKCKLTDFISNMVPLGKVPPAEIDFWSRGDPLEQIYTHAGNVCSSKAPSSGESASTGYSWCNSSAPNGDPHPTNLEEKNTGKSSFPRVFSFPRLPSPRPAQKDAVGSELRYLRRDEGTVLGSNHSQKEKGPMSINAEELLAPSAKGKLPGNPALPCSVRKQSLFNRAGIDEKEGREASHFDKNVVGDVPAKQRYFESFQVPKKATIHNWISEHRCIWKEAKIKACLLPAIAEV